MADLLSLYWAQVNQGKYDQAAETKTKIQDMLEKGEDIMGAGNGAPVAKPKAKTARGQGGRTGAKGKKLKDAPADPESTTDPAPLAETDTTPAADPAGAGDGDASNIQV